MKIRFLNLAEQEVDDAVIAVADQHREPRYWADRIDTISD